MRELESVAPVKQQSEIVGTKVAEQLLPSTYRALNPREARRVATLERKVPTTLGKAKDVGVDIEYLGIAGLFSQPRVYTGEKTDWVFGPAGDHEALVVPRAFARDLQALDAAGLRFPLLYVGHELPKGKVQEVVDQSGGSLVTVDRKDIPTVVGSPPPSAETVELGKQLNHRSEQVLRALRRMLPIVAGIAAAPLILTGAAVAALVGGLDPVVMGAVPVAGRREGDPAFFYVLARWEW